MNRYRDSKESLSHFVSAVEAMLKTHPREDGIVAVARAPAVLDVMGGIGEDSGSLLLTATTGLAFHVAAWRTAGQAVHLRWAAQDAAVEHSDDSLPIAMLASTPAAEIANRCRRDGVEWAAPSLLILHHLWARTGEPGAETGLALVIDTDFPPAADLGRLHVQAAATIDTIYKLFGLEADPNAQSRICAETVGLLEGLCHARKAMTALCAPPDGGLLQLRFEPGNPICEPLRLPEDVIIKGVSTRLGRPTTRRRLIETRTCSEMGHRMILHLQQRDGARPDPRGSRLSAITPTEFVERYRDRMPSKITRQDFLSKFGTVRGLDGDGADPKAVFKIRSRAEHHIYENRRVHDFATNIVRARRNRSEEALNTAGGLMYASHWSHSQRCGIGGVETDRLVSFIRGHGAEAGLFGAKVTAGGEGGELVVLMRDDDRAHAALRDAVARAEEVSRQPVHVFEGCLPGARASEALDLTTLVDSAGAV
ncbi:MAG: hypothetical protein ACE5E1_10935 [Phycisphaerae bacterium]